MARLIAVHSFRGGTGKSNITANIATLLATEGKRVGIVDLDVQSPASTPSSASTRTQPCDIP